MAQRIQKARSREQFERDERQASETLGGRGNKRDLGTNVGGQGGRNVAREAHNPEQQDYDEENRNMLGGTKETGDTETIKAGNYEEDYGVGVQGRREAGQVGEKKDPVKDVLPRSERTWGGKNEDQEDFPTGKWSRQKVRAKLSSAPGAAKSTQEEAQRPKGLKAPTGRGNRGRRADETGAFRGRNAGGNRARHTGLGGKTAAGSERAQPPRGGRAARSRAAGSQTRGGIRTKAASTTATARRKPTHNEGA